MPRDPLEHRPAITVCLATYNGAPWVVEQLESVLHELAPDDEVIVVDDASTDETVTSVRAMNDPRIHIVDQQKNSGHVATFERAARLARGSVVMLCDQDDVWPQGRCRRMIEALEHADLVTGNFALLGDSGVALPRPLRAADSGRGFSNALGLIAGRRAYYGSCMAMRRSLLERALPFPAAVEAHDHWIALVGNIGARTAHLDGPPVTLRRIHGTNLTTGRRGWKEAMLTRGRHLILVATALWRRAN